MSKPPRNSQSPELEDSYPAETRDGLAGQFTHEELILSFAQNEEEWDIKTIKAMTLVLARQTLSPHSPIHRTQEEEALDLLERTRTQAATDEEYQKDASSIVRRIGLVEQLLSSQKKGNIRS